MKKIFLRNKIYKRKKLVIIAGVVLALVFLIIFKSNFSYIISRPILFIAKPILILNNAVRDWFGKIAFIIEEKSELKDENIAFKEKLSGLEAELLFFNVLKEENKELKELLSRTDEKKYLIASILSRPPQSPYDIFIIDAGARHGVKKGMQVTAYTNILLGYVIDVFLKTSKVKLISFPEEETNVLLRPSGISAIALGKGGENLEIILPRAIEMHSGENVITLGINPLLVGIVERVEIDITDAFQKILFRLPINIQELKYVLLKLE